MSSSDSADRERGDEGLGIRNPGDAGGARVNDVLPLRSRLGVLGLVRVALAGLVAGTPPALGTASTERPGAFVAAAALAGSAALFELVRRAQGVVPSWQLGASLLVDGLCLVAAVSLTGGPSGPLAPILAIHLVAVTLLASYRTGLKVAMWHALLLAVAYHAQRAGRLGGRPPALDTVVQSAVMLSLVALFTATCSAFNERELRRSRAGFRALAEMSSRLGQAGSPHAVRDELVRTVVEHTGYRRSAVLIAGDGGQADGTNWPDRLVMAEPVEEAGPAGGLVDRCWRGHQPVLAATVDEAADPMLAALLPSARNVVLVPVGTGDGPLGVLAVERAGRRRARVPASQVDLLAQFAAHAALAHRNAALAERLRRMAAVDGLTGLANRRAFDDALTAEVRRARRNHQPLSLVLIDADHFKRVNDTHGHGAGDDVLRAVGRVLAGGRATDVAARYGGEEFAVLLPGCTAAEAFGVAERMRAGIAAAAAHVAVTASAGVASLSADLTDERALVAAADAALYRAKASGRDRTIVAECPSPAEPSSARPAEPSSARPAGPVARAS